MLDTVLALSEGAMAADSAHGASHAFYTAFEKHGGTYLQLRRYRRPAGYLTSASHWAAGGFVARYCRPGWVGSAAFNYICFEQNPMLEPVRRGMTRYRNSDFAPHAAARYGDYWDAFSEAGIADMLTATAYGRSRGIASLAMGFGTREIDPVLAFSVQTAASMLVEKLIAEDAGAPDGIVEPVLSARERDALAFVAEGKTDWEIAKIFGVSESTARFHVDNARKKLGAVNRAHAVARFMAASGPF